MSYVRFGWGPDNEYPGSTAARVAGPSSLYMFPTIDGGNGNAVECCGCILNGSSVTLDTFTEVVAHLDEHRKAGHTVHPFVEPAIEEDFKSGFLRG